MPIRFRKQFLAAQPYESAGIADVNGDGFPDIISGAWWYEGPDFTKKHRIWHPPACGDYFDDFSTITLDATGNNFPDIITGGFFGRTLFLLENVDGGKTWVTHEIAKPGNIETTRAWDMDGDGDLEIIPNVLGGPLIVYKLVRDAEGKPTGQFSEHCLWDGRQGHGLGFGDVNNDGRPDFVFAGGWLESPVSGRLYEDAWVFHPDWTMDRPSIPMIVADVDGDGHNEMIVGRAHDYGLDWFKHDGAKWKAHPIDPYASQYHDLIWMDIDGDGQSELITGKRYWAHCGSDPGETDDLGIYIFKWTGEGFVKQPIDYGPHGIGKGCGIHFAIGDLNGDGRPDIVAPGKDGLAIYWNLPL